MFIIIPVISIEIWDIYIKYQYNSSYYYYYKPLIQII